MSKQIIILMQQMYTEEVLYLNLVSRASIYKKHILKLLNSTCLSMWSTQREFSVSDSDRREKFHWYLEHDICFNALKRI